MLRGGREKTEEYGVKYPTSPKARVRQNQGSIMKLLLLLETRRAVRICAHLCA